MSHVPEHNLIRYRHLKNISRLFDSAGDNLGAQFAEDANKAYALSAKYNKLAQELRAQPENPCPFTHSHTKHWCGYEGCREG